MYEEIGIMYRKIGAQVGILFLFIGIVCLVAVPLKSVMFPDRVLWEAEQPKEREWHFRQIAVEDDGKETWERVLEEEMASSVTVNEYDYFSEEQYVIREDGSVCLEDVDTMHLNNVWFSVPGEGGTRVFGEPVFTTELMAEGEWEAMDEWHERDMTSRQYDAAFNAGMEETRQLIKGGYLQAYLETYLKQYPEFDPDERTYTLQFISGGKTDRNEDDTSWWDLNYRLVTTGENGEIISMGWLEIHKTLKARGYAVTDDADYSMYSDGRGFWRLLEDTATDKGQIWINQLPEEEFSDIRAVRAFIEKNGAALLLPEGADAKLIWKYRKEEGFWYDYLLWYGETADYEVTFAVPLMPEGSGGWYLASRIRKDAADKQACAHVLSVMMQTLRTEPYVYTVKEGDTLIGISRKYIHGEGTEYAYRQIAYLNGISDPDLIYPGQQFALPEYDTGKNWKAQQPFLEKGAVAP